MFSDLLDGTQTEMADGTRPKRYGACPPDSLQYGSVVLSTLLCTRPTGDSVICFCCTTQRRGGTLRLWSARPGNARDRRASIGLGSVSMSAATARQLTEKSVILGSVWKSNGSKKRVPLSSRIPHAKHLFPVSRHGPGLGGVQTDFEALSVSRLSGCLAELDRNGVFAGTTT